MFSKIGSGLASMFNFGSSKPAEPSVPKQELVEQPSSKEDNKEEPPKEENVEEPKPAPPPPIRDDSSSSASSSEPDIENMDKEQYW